MEKRKPERTPENKAVTPPENKAPHFMLPRKKKPKQETKTK